MKGSRGDERQIAKRRRRQEDVAVNHFNFSPLWLIGERRIIHVREAALYRLVQDSVYLRLRLAKGTSFKKKGIKTKIFKR